MPHCTILLSLVRRRMNPFDLKAALSADHAQHPVIIHFPIALFIASAVFDLLAVWRKQSFLASVAYYNLVGAAISVPLGLAYFALTLLAVAIITLTGHLGGFLSGVETP